MDNIEIEKVAKAKVKRKNMYDDFRNEILELVENLENDKVLIIKNVDIQHENVVRTSIKSTSFFAKKLGKIFSVSRKKDRILYVSVKGEQPKFNKLNFFTEDEKNRLAKFKNKLFEDERYELAEAIENIIIDYSEIDE